MIFSIYCRLDTVSSELSVKINQTLIETYNWHRDDDNPQLVICIGGDGTLLRAIHTYMYQLDQTLFVAIHTGTLGFFTDYTQHELDVFLDDLANKPFQIESYPLLQCDDERGRTFYALNEFMIGCFSRTAKFNVYVDNEYFETVIGSGLCVSSQPGSTGANRALGGAVIEDGLNVMELCQIMPVSHKAQHSMVSPYILRQDRVLTVQGDSLMDCILSYDHLDERDMREIKYLKIRYSDRAVHFARFRPYSYLKRLKNLY